MHFEENLDSLCKENICELEPGITIRVDAVISGELLVLSGKYILNTRIIDIYSRNVVWSNTERCISEAQLEQITKRTCLKIRKYFGEDVEIPVLRYPEDPDSADRGLTIITPEIIIISPPQITTMRPKVRQDYFIEGTKGGPMLFVSEGKFFIDKYEVTNFDYQQCVKEEGCRPNENYQGFGAAEQPVVGVNLPQAKSFCRWANKRLPTEMEWVAAARGEGHDVYPWGDDLSCELANYKSCKNSTTRNVGSYISGASKYGAMDMAGNVWEWTDSGTLHGGSFRESRRKLEVGYWYNINTNTRRDDIGFRCAYSSQ